MADEFVGTWRYDTTTGKPESVDNWRAGITDIQGRPWGTAVGLGWTGAVRVYIHGTKTPVTTIAATGWEDATEGALLIPVGAATALYPIAGGEPIDYDALIVLTDGVNISVRGPQGGGVFIFRMARVP